MLPEALAGSPAAGWRDSTLEAAAPDPRRRTTRGWIVVWRGRARASKGSPLQEHRDQSILAKMKSEQQQQPRLELCHRPQKQIRSRTLHGAATPRMSFLR